MPAAVRVAFSVLVLLAFCFATGRSTPARAAGKEKAPNDAKAEPKADAPADAVPYDVDHDAPLDAKEEWLAETPDYVKYRVEFNGILKDRVPAYLYLPRDEDGGPHPAVLLQYGSGGNKNTRYIVAIAEQCARRGFVVLTIDVPNRGERRRRRGPDRDQQGGLWQQMVGRGGTIRQTLGDYSRAVDYLFTRPEVDQQRVGYVGISLGAITGVTFVANDTRVSAMASIVGGGNLLGSIRRADLIQPEARRIAEQIDPYYHVAKIAPRPLLLINVTRDVLVPRFFGESLHKAAGDRENVKKVWLDTDHFFSDVDRYAVFEEVIDFLQQHLNAADGAGTRPAPPARAGNE